MSRPGRCRQRFGDPGTTAGRNVRQNPVWELTTSVSLILPVFPSRRSRPRELFCPCARLYCRDRSAVHTIHKSVVLYNVPSTTRAALVAAQPGTTQVAGKEGPICLIPKPEIADGIDRKSPASGRKRPRESLHNVSTCWTVLLSSLSCSVFHDCCRCHNLTIMGSMHSSLSHQ